MVNEIYIIDNESELVARIANLFIDDQDYVFKHIVTSDIEVALKNIPSLIIINEDNIGMDIIDLCSVIQKNLGDASILYLVHMVIFCSGVFGADHSYSGNNNCWVFIGW